MSINIVTSLSILITCLAFSQKSFSHWGPWGENDAKSTWCEHRDNTGGISYADLEIKYVRGKSKYYMRVARGSAANTLKPQIIYTNDRLKKLRPYFPIERAELNSSHITSINHHLGSIKWEPGERYACRVSDQ